MKWIDIVTRKQNILLIYTKAYGWSEKMKDIFGVGFNHMLMVSYKEATTYYVYKTELKKLINILKNKLIKEKPGEQSLARKGVKLFQNVIDYLKIINKKNLQKATNKELASYFNNYFKKQVKSLPFLVLPTFVDDIFVEIIQKRLKENIKLLADKKLKRIFEYINILTTLEEESYATQAEHELLDLALEIFREGKKFSQKNLVQIQNYTKKWEWLPIQAEEEPYDINYFKNELKKLLTSSAKIQKRLLELHKHTETIKNKKARLIKDLKFNQLYRRLIDVFQGWVYLKDFRRSIISQERLYSRLLYVEIGKRLNLTGREVRFLSPNELINALNSRDSLPDKDEIYARMEMFVLLRRNKIINLLIKEEANKIVKKELPVSKISGQKTLKGTPASPGKAIGKARIVLGMQDETKICGGKDILIARQTTPDLLKAMKKSVAIITDEGGLLCHAAIVSRELGKPCIVGTKIATKVLKDGDLVEVDANKGIVKILSK